MFGPITVGRLNRSQLHVALFVYVTCAGFMLQIGDVFKRVVSNNQCYAVSG